MDGMEGGKKADGGARTYRLMNEWMNVCMQWMNEWMNEDWRTDRTDGRLTRQNKLILRLLSEHKVLLKRKVPLKQSSVVTNGINTKPGFDEVTRHYVSDKTCISNHFPLARHPQLQSGSMLTAKEENKYTDDRQTKQENTPMEREKWILWPRPSPTVPKKW